MYKKITNSNDKVTINFFGISPTHVLVNTLSDQNFPQILSSDILECALQTFEMTSNKSLRLGYNSVGAGCFINQIHFELLFLDDLGLDSLLPETAPTELLFRTDLAYKDSDELAMVKI